MNKIRNENQERKPEIKPEDKYEPEFSLEDDDSNDAKMIKEESKDKYVIRNYYNFNKQRRRVIFLNPCRVKLHFRSHKKSEHYIKII